MAERSAALKKAQQKYMEKYSFARVRMERIQYERLQAHAAAQGESVNGFINRAIDSQMIRDASGEALGEPVDDLTTKIQPVPPGTLAAAEAAAKAAGEELPVFVTRAVETQAQRDTLSRKMKGGKANE
ncbi:MAG: hypothetical protein K2L38_11220 [Dysosmobacter sp.]|nr:hypothetical protein [Dysosmobacter sp.]